MQPITVAELIEFLKTQRQDLPVCYKCLSEHALLGVDEITVKSFGHPRPDGWVHDPRPDAPTTEYLVFPGN